MDFSKLTAYLDTLEEKYEVHGLDIQVCKDHEVLYRHMAGHSDYDRKVPVSGKDLYNIYSCTKVTTMTGVMQLIEKGKLGLNDTLSQYLPEFKEMRVDPTFRPGVFPFTWPTLATPTVPAEAPILIHDLMSMTAGFSYDINSEPIRQVQRRTANKGTTRQVVSAMAKMPLICQPGTRYSYSLSHDVLAAVVEVVTGMTFGEYMRENVFEPLGMTDVYYQVPAGQAHRLSAQYARDFETGVIRPDHSMAYRLTENYESGGAGLAITVNDYSKLVDALACGGMGASGKRILKPESVLLMSKNWLNETQLQDFAKTGKVGYGYGLGVRTLIDGSKSKSPVGEFGWDGAAGAYALVDPKNHVSVFYAHEILGMLAAYSEIHPAIRDLVYEALER